MKKQSKVRFTLPVNGMVTKLAKGEVRMKGNLFRIRGDIDKRIYLLGAVSAFVLVLAAWWVVSASGWVTSLFLPSPIVIIQQLFVQLQNPAFLGDLGFSFFRVTVGFLIAAVIGVPLGILAGTFRFAESFIAPLMEFIRYMPATAFIPLTMVWFGIGESAKIAIIFIGTFFQIVLMVMENARSVPHSLLEASFTLGITRWQAIRRVVIPAMLPDLVTTLRLTLGWAWTYVVVAEMVAANNGLGYAIMQGQRFMNVKLIFAGILTIGLVGLITDRIIAIGQRKIFFWTEA